MKFTDRISSPFHILENIAAEVCLIRQALQTIALQEGATKTLNDQLRASIKQNSDAAAYWTLLIAEKEAKEKK